MLKPVNVQHDDGHATGWVTTLCTGGLYLFLYRLAKTGAVGQPSQTVPVGQGTNFGLLRTNIHAHGVKGLGQLSDLIAPVRVLHGYVVLAASQHLGGVNQ